MPVNRDNVPHYTWGEGCDGWTLSPNADLLVIQERMLPHTKEVRHRHSKSRQFFYVLSGELCMEREGELHRLAPGDGIEIRPTAKHQARNDRDEAVEFIVVSAPTTRGDRTDLP